MIELLIQGSKHRFRITDDARLPSVAARLVLRRHDSISKVTVEYQNDF